MKPIFIDVDGTIANHEQQITPRTVAAVAAAREAGYEPMICTWRSVSRAIALSNQIGADYLIY